MTEDEKREWLLRVEELTVHFNSNPSPITYPFEIGGYFRMKEESNYPKFITEMWQENYDRIEKLFLENCENLLEDDLIRFAFFLSAGGIWQKIQLPYLESRWEDKTLRSLLIEDTVLNPTITSSEYQSSETLINHLTHLTEFEEKAKVELSSFERIVEFGGGYGSMCRLFKRICRNISYVIIDLPALLYIQAYYLMNLFGDQQVNIVYGSDHAQEGKINLIDISNVSALESLLKWDVDLFVATWSLSEANEYTQQYIYDKRYFNSKYMLLGYRHYEIPNPRQPCSDSIQLTPNYEILYQGSTFFALEEEQYYIFARKLHAVAQ